MWFITSILFRRDSIENPSWLYDSKRTFGFYVNCSDAMAAIKENRCNMHECLYNFLVLEEVAEGIHPIAETEVWFEWSDTGGWIISKKPAEYDCVINWAIG